MSNGRRTEAANRYAGGEWRGPNLMQAFRLGHRVHGAPARSADILVRVGGDVEQVRAALEDHVMEPPRETDWHVVVPVKGGRGAKSRLRRSFDDQTVVAAIIHDTLDVVSQVVAPSGVVVVTGDEDETAHAHAAGFTVVADPGTGLNEACLSGVRWAQAGGATAVAILLGDHPALTPDELRSALKAGADHATFFVPDADGLGTALVGATGPGVPDLAFGPGSAALHVALGHARLELDLPGLRHDVDDEVSLHHAATHLTLGPRTRHALGR